MNIDKLNGLLNKNIVIVEFKEHRKASEKYISVIFTYPKNTWSGWVPYSYRRGGLDITTEEELSEFLLVVYSNLEIGKVNLWIKGQRYLWNKGYAKKEITKPYFISLLKNDWSCRKCVTLITKSSNDARRIQDLKEMGYLTSTDTKRFCTTCNENTTQDLLIPNTVFKATGYETWSPKLRAKIISTLKNIDIYEDKLMSKSSHLLPDHKFPEIRWDSNTKEVNSDDMTEEEIKNKFQLINNQRNQQKREVCRICFQTNKRGVIFGIPYFYKGDENWPSKIKTSGKESEVGCIGCGWYDIEKWRESLNKTLSTDS